MLADGLRAASRMSTSLILPLTPDIVTGLGSRIRYREGDSLTRAGFEGHSYVGKGTLVVMLWMVVLVDMLNTVSLYSGARVPHSSFHRCCSGGLQLN